MRASLASLPVLAILAAAGSVAHAVPDPVKARELYSRIIEFRSAAGHGQTGPMADYLKGVLQGAGVPATDITTLEEGEATAMIVRLPGRSAEARPILFSSHMDVVDARPEEWERSPFKLVEENGNFYGRGTSDNKAGVAAMVATILSFRSEGLQPGRTLVFAFVGDEETGMRTTGLVAAHPWVKDAEFAINTDAGGGLLDGAGKDQIYLVQGAEKTYATFVLTVRNPGGHSSRPRPDNAINQLAHALVKVEAYRFPVMSNDLTRKYLGAVGAAESGALGVALRKFSVDPNDAGAAEEISRSPEFAGTTRTTCIATMLDAGHAENALPQTAKAVVNCRIFPGVTVEAVRATLAETIADREVDISVRGSPVASPVSEMRPDVMAAIARAVHVEHPGVAVVPYLESGGTDGKVYRSVGIPTFATSGGFMKPSEMYAHGLNERLPVAAFYEGLDHIYRLAVELGKP